MLPLLLDRVVNGDMEVNVDAAIYNMIIINLLVPNWYKSQTTNNDSNIYYLPVMSSIGTAVITVADVDVEDLLSVLGSVIVRLVSTV